MPKTPGANQDRQDAAVNIEIERKFLLKNDAWRGLAPGLEYRQGYLCTEKGRTVRVRLADTQAFLTIKGPNERGAAVEFNYPIPLMDAVYMLDNLAQRPLIEKVRYRIAYQGLVWEVDEFLGENTGLVLAEVELEFVEQEFDKPDWVGDEVTGDARYYNANLVAQPYSTW